MRFAWALSIVCACSSKGSTPFMDAPQDPRQQVVSIRATPNRNVDLLFVVDDSGSMADKQNNLAVNFPNFINVLSSIEGGLPDIHIAVVTTDMGTKGTAVPTPGPGIGTLGQGGCAMSGKDGVFQTNGATVTGNFISDIRQTDGTRLKNYTGQLATVFAQMARVGATGCGFEQPLHAMKRALANNPSNAGFLRPDAVLGVMFLADEDDCSIKDPAVFGPESATLGPLTSFRCTRFGVTCATGGQTPDQMNQIGAKANCSAASQSQFLDDIGPYRDFLLSLKSDPSKIVVGGILGALEPFAVEIRNTAGTNQIALAHSCMYQGPAGIEVADPGTRIKTLLDEFPNRAAFSTICQPDLSVALENLGQLVTRSIGTACVLDTLLDVDTATPGLQVDCVVEDVVGANATPVPKCSSPDTPPCWRLDTDPQGCPAAEHLKLVVVRSGAPDPTTVTNMRCRVQ
jgi:hypothetical protein